MSKIPAGGKFEVLLPFLGSLLAAALGGRGGLRAGSQAGSRGPGTAPGEPLGGPPGGLGGLRMVFKLEIPGSYKSGPPS